jgi:GMP synthase (glutamine-hydrolysing)
LKDIILSIQNTEIETLGNFKELFESDGYKIETIHVKKDKIPQEPVKYAAIVILGGCMSVYEALPYLNEEQDLIKKGQSSSSSPNWNLSRLAINCPSIRWQSV